MSISKQPPIHHLSKPLQPMARFFGTSTPSSLLFLLFHSHPPFAHPTTFRRVSISSRRSVCLPLALFHLPISSLAFKSPPAPVAWLLLLTVAQHRTPACPPLLSLSLPVLRLQPQDLLPLQIHCLLPSNIIFLSLLSLLLCFLLSLNTHKLGSAFSLFSHFEAAAAGLVQPQKLLQKQFLLPLLLLLVVMAGYNYRGSRSNGSPETPGIKGNDRNPEVGVPLFSFVSTHGPYFYPDVQNEQQQEKSLPQLYPYLPMDDSSVFPVFPVEMEPQGGGFDMGGSCSNNSTFGFNYFDPFQVELGTIEEGLVQGTIGAAAAAAAAASSSFSLPVVERPPRLLVERWSPLIAKAARSKRRIVRQMSGGPRSYSLHHRSSASDSVSSAPSTRSSKKKNDSASATSASSSSSSPSQAADDLISHPLSENNEKLRLVLKKELKNSDVSSLGRIVLPKREAELNLPCLTAKEGVHLLIRDMISPRLWSMRYRYWPNNKSKMYVLENTGDFVRKHGLRVGDFIVLYKDEDNQLFISATKVERTTAAAPNTEQTMEDDKEKTLEENGDMKLAMACSATEESSIGGGRVSTQLALAVAEPPSTQLLTPEEEAAFSLDPSAVGLNDCVFSHLERLPGFEDCDLSLYDDLMEEEEKPFRWRR